MDAFTRIRAAAEKHMDDRDSHGHGWDEETVTGVSTHKGAPQVKVTYFTKQSKSRSSAPTTCGGSSTGKARSVSGCWSKRND